MRDLLFASGAVLPAATQLRPGVLPIGFGELLLVAWLGCLACRWVYHPTLVIERPLVRLALFWLPMIVSLCVGMIVGMSIELYLDVSGINHDIAAYSLMLLVSCALVLELREDAHRRRMAWTVVMVATAMFLVQLGEAGGLYRLPLGSDVDPWLYNRFRGWSKDPNQLGFLAAAVTLILVHLADTSPRSWSQFSALGLLALAILVGLLTRSDTFLVSIVAGIGVFVALSIPKLTRPEVKRLGLWPATVMIVALALPLMVASTVTIAPAVAQRLQAFTSEVYDQDNQGETRLKLWSESIDKGLNSYLLGFGPGPHLTDKSWKRPPPDKFESHNAPLHLLTQGGLLAVLALLWMFASAFTDAVRARLPALAAIVIGFFVFSMFHVIFRLPIFWFGIALCLLEAAAVGASARRRSSRVQSTSAI